MSALEHIREIEAALSERTVERDGFVVESWRRCVEQHGLDPARPSPAYILPNQQLRRHQQKAERLTSIARSGVEDLFQQIAGQNYVLLLTDAQGVTVDYFGDTKFEDDLRKAGLFLGSSWSEEHSGTNGIGECLATGRAVTVHQQDHFDSNHIQLSCSAAPIYDLEGALAAVLDVSLLRSPQPKTTQALALHMVKGAARRIELANLMAEMRTEWVLRFSARPDFVDVDPDAALAVDSSGVVIGATHQAVRLLGDTAGRSILGRSLKELFEIEIEDLPTFSRARAAEERRLFLKTGQLVYAHAIAPQPLMRRRTQPADAQLSKPFAALHCGDPVMQHCLATAAQLAKNDLPIWITGASGTGKERLARAIHKERDPHAPFIVVQCADFPEQELDTILFGQGDGREGLVAQARNGVLLLDEVAELPARIQARLARALSDDGLRPTDGVNPVPIKAKLVSTSTTSVAQSGLRTDLLFRLSGARLDLPDLADRTDFDGLVDRLIRLIGIATPVTYQITDAARSELRHRDWPGNIRELKNTLRVAMSMTDTGRIDIEQIPKPVLASLPSRSTDYACELERTLKDCGWNISRVARLRGVNRSTIHRQIKRAGLYRR